MERAVDMNDLAYSKYSKYLESELTYDNLYKAGDTDGLKEFLFGLYQDTIFCRVWSGKDSVHITHLMHLYNKYNKKCWKDIHDIREGKIYDQMKYLCRYYTIFLPIVRKCLLHNYSDLNIEQA